MYVSGFLVLRLRFALIGYAQLAFEVLGVVVV